MFVPLLWAGAAAVCLVKAFYETLQASGFEAVAERERLNWLDHQADKLAEGKFPQGAEDRIRAIAAEEAKPKTP